MEQQRVLYVGCGHDKQAHEIFREPWAEARTAPGKPDHLAKLFPNAGARKPVSATS